jgi:hypothetical protein
LARLSHLCIALASAVILLAPAASEAAEEYVLSISPHNYGVVFTSGNLTATATYSWPRVVFQHSYEYFWPVFEVGFPRIFLFNDTDADGRFDANETLCRGYLDEYHTTWSIVEPVIGVDPALGQYAEFGMRSTVSLYDDPDNMTAVVNDWSNITFWFRVVENGEVFGNSAGYFVVQGKIEMRLNVTIEILNETLCSGLAMEQVLKGGGTTEMFILRELNSTSQENLTMVSSRVDETVEGLNVTHDLRETLQPRQEARFARDDWVARAFYFWNSEVNLTEDDGLQCWKPVNSTYYTTGTGLVVQSFYPCGDNTTVLSTDMSLGLIDQVNETTASDWVKENMTVLAVVAVSVALLAVLSAVVIRRRRRVRAAEQQKPPEDEPEEEKAS